MSSLINSSPESNNLSVKKNGNYFYFYINKIEIARRYIEDFQGGGLGIISGNRVNVSYDNFNITKLTFYDENLELYTYASETFTLSSGGFKESKLFKLNNGVYSFKYIEESDSNLIYNQLWQGGINPDSINPFAENSNYFENFCVSVDTFKKVGLDDKAYGVYLYLFNNLDQSFHKIRFFIYSNGNYIVDRLNESGEIVNIVNFSSSSLIKTDGTLNTISIIRKNNDFKFFVNNNLLRTRTLNGYSGGGIGINSNENVEVDFDNFIVTRTGSFDEELTEELNVKSKDGSCFINSILD